MLKRHRAFFESLSSRNSMKSCYSIVLSKVFKPLSDSERIGCIYYNVDNSNSSPITEADFNSTTPFIAYSISPFLSFFFIWVSLM